MPEELRWNDALAYLRSFIPRATRDITLATLCAFCGGLAAARDIDLRESAFPLAVALEESLQGRAVADVDAVLVALAHHELRRANLAGANLERICGEIVVALGEEDEKTFADPRLRVLTATLRDSGFALVVPTGAAPSEVIALVHNPAVLFDAAEDVLQSLCDYVDAGDVALTGVLSEVLALIALGELRKYRIDVGARLLRTIARHGTVTRAYDDAIAFLAIQQRSNGAFGFLNPLASLDLADVEREFFLPISVNALWTLSWERDRMMGLARV